MSGETVQITRELTVESATCLHSVGMMMGDPYVINLGYQLAMAAGLDLSALSKDDESSRRAGFQEAIGFMGSVEVQRLIGSRNAARLQEVLVEELGDRDQ